MDYNKGKAICKYGTLSHIVEVTKWEAIIALPQAIPNTMTDKNDTSLMSKTVKSLQFRCTGKTEKCPICGEEMMIYEFIGER
ncbi:MAG: hypothetical protein ACQCN6_01565 [Candidatus Bathyarchaeia archaeon]|jgi:hypothetical protein